VNLSTSTVVHHNQLGRNTHGPADGAEMIAVEKLVLGDTWVLRELDKLKLPEGTKVVCDPWIYGEIIKIFQRTLMNCRR